MTTLPTLPCWLRVRPFKGMSVNELYPDIELDRIMLANETARRAKAFSVRASPAGSSPVPGRRVRV
jgi:hypothetical protein